MTKQRYDDQKKRKNADWHLRRYLKLPATATIVSKLNLSSPFVMVMLTLQLTMMATTVAASAENAEADLEDSINNASTDFLIADSATAVIPRQALVREQLNALTPSGFAKQIATHAPEFHHVSCEMRFFANKHKQGSVAARAKCFATPAEPAQFSKKDLADNIDLFTHALDTKTRHRPSLAFSSLMEVYTNGWAHTGDYEAHIERIILRSGLLEQWSLPMTKANRAQTIAMQAFIHKVIVDKEEFFSTASAKDLFAHYEEINRQIELYLRKEILQNKNGKKVLTEDIEALTRACK